MEDPQKQRWRKILYEKQYYHDNYIDVNNFLEHIDTTSRLDTYSLSYGKLVFDTSVVAHQVTIIVIFLTIYKYIVRGQSLPKINGYIALIDVLLLLLCYCTNRWTQHGGSRPSGGSIDAAGSTSRTYHVPYQTVQNQAQENIENGGLFTTIQSSCVFVICLRLAAPILQTLTSSFSDDTIHALAIVFSTLHLVFYDYEFVDNLDGGGVSGTLSLNAAMFTAVLLASRLNNLEVVLGFILLAVIVFTIFPIVIRSVKARDASLYFTATVFMSLLAFVMLWRLDVTLFAIYFIVLVFIWIVCPFWLMRMQIYKKTVNAYAHKIPQHF